MLFRSIQSTGDLTDSTTDIAANKVIYDALAKKVSIVEGAQDNVVVFGAGNTIADSAKKIGGSALASSPNANTIATEAAVKAAVDDALEWKTF